MNIFLLAANGWMLLTLTFLDDVDIGRIFQTVYCFRLPTINKKYRGGRGEVVETFYTFRLLAVNGRKKGRGGGWVESLNHNFQKKISRML